jgi:hypothetical protein
LILCFGAQGRYPPVSALRPHIDRAKLLGNIVLGGKQLALSFDPWCVAKAGALQMQRELKLRF